MAPRRASPCRYQRAGDNSTAPATHPGGTGLACPRAQCATIVQRGGIDAGRMEGVDDLPNGVPATTDDEPTDPPRVDRAKVRVIGSHPGRRIGKSAGSFARGGSGSRPNQRRHR